MSMNAFPRRQGLRPAALLSVAALAATALIATAGPAGAALFQSNADQADGAPAFFRDSQGIALQLCVEACAEAPAEGEPEPEAPAANHSPYFMAAASVGGVVDVGWELATIPAEDPVTEEELETVGGVENGVRIGADQGALRANSRYRLEGPWGVHFFRTDDRGGADLRIASGGEAGSTLNGPVQGFLVGVNANGPMIGNPEVRTLVTGSPTGFNQVTVTGPGLRATSKRFFLTGQKRENTAMSSVNKDALQWRSQKRLVTKTVRFSSFGTAAARPVVSKLGTNRARFRVQNTCGAVAPGRGCAIQVTYRPRAKVDRAVLVINDNSMARPYRVRLRG
jgi:hypothetical protein